MAKNLSFDSRWLILFVIILSVTITTVMMNNNHNDNTANQITSTIDADNGDLKINWDLYPTTNIELEDSLEINTPGTYHITGSLSNGMIHIAAKTSDVVRLQLDNVSIKNSTGPAILCDSIDDLVIELIGENILEDGTTYTSISDSDVTGSLFSKADTTIKGDGSLIVKANYQDAIVSKDDLKIDGGKYNITANDDGIRGTDSVYITNGDITIVAKADGVKSTNETTSGKGFVLIEDGNFSINAGAKGIKAINSILIYDGKFNIKSIDDAIHSNNYIGIINGDINISANDDGIHADRELIIDDGKITIAKAYEGLEAQRIVINDGTISLKTTDDGINAGGGADESSNNRPGANAFDADENCSIEINGGDLYVNAAGDGIDSNGWLNINGGNIVVDGPTNNGNGALDAGMGIVMNGGKAIAIGASGMAESLGSSSSILNVSIYLDTTEPEDTSIIIKSSNNEIIFEHTSAKSFNHIAAGSPKFTLGETYTLYINNEKSKEFTISDITTTVGNSKTNQSMSPMRPFGN